MESQLSVEHSKSSLNLSTERKANKVLKEREKEGRTCIWGTKVDKLVQTACLESRSTMIMRIRLISTRSWKLLQRIVKAIYKAIPSLSHQSKTIHHLTKAAVLVFISNPIHQSVMLIFNWLGMENRRRRVLDWGHLIANSKSYVKITSIASKQN